MYYFLSGAWMSEWSKELVLRSSRQLSAWVRTPLHAKQIIFHTMLLDDMNLLTYNIFTKTKNEFLFCRR